jgi:hypothetical protein
MRPTDVRGVRTVSAQPADMSVRFPTRSGGTADTGQMDREVRSTPGLPRRADLGLRADLAKCRNAAHKPASHGAGARWRAAAARSRDHRVTTPLLTCTDRAVMRYRIAGFSPDLAVGGVRL